jgi:hypothetical protein
MVSFISKAAIAFENQSLVLFCSYGFQSITVNSPLVSGCFDFSKIGNLYGKPK